MHVCIIYTYIYWLIEIWDFSYKYKSLHKCTCLPQQESIEEKKTPCSF